MGAAVVPLFQSTLPVRGGTAELNQGQTWDFISIHPPREGRDREWSVRMLLELISIHPPREGRDICGGLYTVYNLRFQSTLPVRGGTSARCTPASSYKFQSTLPVRGGTATGLLLLRRLNISIHPPRKGRDHLELGTAIITKNFNPPSPQGEGLVMVRSQEATFRFQSTLPARGGTVVDGTLQSGFDISIHPPRKGRDSKSTQKSFSISCTFYKFSRIFRHHILFSGRESKNRRRISQNLSAKVSGKSWALPPRTGLDHQSPAGIVAGFHPIVGDLFRVVVS